MRERLAYETWHEQFEVDAHADTPWHSLLREHLAAQDLAGKRLLEIGCGRGGLACGLAAAPDRPLQIVGADYAATALRKAQSFARQNRLLVINWEVVDIQAIAHPSETFDTVISCETIEHVPNPQKAIAELARVLRPGGRLFVTTPNYLGALGLYRAYLRLRGRQYTEVGQPINKFMLLPLTRYWVKQAGLRVTAVDAVGHYLPVPGRPPVRLTLLDNFRLLTRWFGLHSLVSAVKPAN